MNIKKILIALIFVILTVTNIYAIEPFKEINIKNKYDTSQYNKITFSDSGRYIIAAKDNGNVYIWETESGKLIKNITVPESNIINFSTNKEDTLLLITSPTNLLVVGLNYLEIEQNIKVSKEIICSDISNDGKTAVIGYVDGSVCAFDTYLGKIIKKVLPSRDSDIISLQYSIGSSRLLISYDDGTIIITDEKGQKILLNKKDKNKIIKSSFSKNSTYIVSTHPNNTLKIHSIYEYELIGQYNIEDSLLNNNIYANYYTSRFYLVGENEEINELEFDKNGKLNRNILNISIIDMEKMALSPAIKKGAIIRGDGTIIEVYNLDTNKVNRLSHNAIVESITTIESGTEAFVVCSNNILSRININSETIINEYLLEKEEYHILDSDKINKTLAIATSSGNIKIYRYFQSDSTENIAILNEIQIEDNISSIKLLEGKEWILIGTNTGYLYSYDIKTGLEIFKIGTHNGKINMIETDKDEKCAYSVGDDGYVVKTSLIDNYDEQYRMKNHKKAVSIELSKLEPYLITGGSEGKLSLWNINLDFKPIKSFDLIKSPILSITHIDSEKILKLPENQDYIVENPDSEFETNINQFHSFILVTAENGINYLIRLNDFKIMHVFDETQENISSAELTEDSAYIVSTGNNGNLNIHDTNYILGFAYYSAGLFNEALTFINKAYELDEKSDNHYAMIRDRKKQADILTKLERYNEAISILQDMNLFLEVSPIILSPYIEDGTIENKNNRIKPIIPNRDEKLDSKIIEDYKTIVLKPHIKDFEYISQLQLAFTKYSTSKKYTNVVDNYIQIGDIYLEKLYDYTMARAYYMKAINVAKESNINLLIAKSYYKFGLATQKYAIIIRRLGLELEADTLESVADVNIYVGIDTLKDLKDLNTLALGYESFGDAYSLRKEYTLALDYYEKALEIYSNLNKQLNKIRILKKLSEACLVGKHIQNSVEYITKALSEAKELTIYQTIGNLYYHYAKLFLDFGHYKNALYYSRKANESFSIHSSTEDLILNLLVQSQIYLETGDYDGSFDTLEYASEIAETSGIKSIKYAISNRIAYIEYKRGKGIDYSNNILNKNINELNKYVVSKPIEAETYYIFFLINREENYEYKQLFLDYLKLALDISLSIYTFEYDNYLIEAEKEGLKYSPK